MRANGPPSLVVVCAIGRDAVVVRWRTESHLENIHVDKSGASITRERMAAQQLLIGNRRGEEKRKQG